MKIRRKELVTLYLRLLDAKLDVMLVKLDALSAVDAGLAAVQAELSGLREVQAATQAEVEQASKRLARIERRLDLQEVRG